MRNFVYDHAIRLINNDHGFFMALDDKKLHGERQKALLTAFFEEDFESDVAKYFKHATVQAIKKSSLAYPDTRRSIDIVRDVTNVVFPASTAQRFAFPRRTAEHPRGLLSLSQYHEMYMALFITQTVSIFQHNAYPLMEVGDKLSPLLRGVFEAHLKNRTGTKEAVVDWLVKDTAYEVDATANRLYHSLRAASVPMGDVITDIIGISTVPAVTVPYQAALLIDLFLSEGYETYKERIIELANSPESDIAANRELLGFVMEGMRHAAVKPFLPRPVARDTSFTDGARGDVHLKSHEIVLVAVAKAAMDPKAFPNPEILDPHRSLEDYILFGHGVHACFGTRMATASLSAVLREVFRLKNVRRANARLGRMGIVEREMSGLKVRTYLDESAKESPMPRSMTLLYDE